MSLVSSRFIVPTPSLILFSRQFRLFIRKCFQNYSSVMLELSCHSRSDSVILFLSALFIAYSVQSEFLIFRFKLTNFKQVIRIYQTTCRKCFLILIQRITSIDQIEYPSPISKI